MTTATRVLNYFGPGFPGPEEHVTHKITFDRTRGVFVRFGGFSVLGSDNTWELDPSAAEPRWEQKFPLTRPRERGDHYQWWDPVSGLTIMHGGIGDPFDYLSDTWTWDGIDWVELTGVIPPTTERFFGAHAYDEARKKFILFGGRLADFSGNALQDTWEWDGGAATSWIDVTPGGTKPAKRTGSHMAFDPIRSESILFGGLDETVPAAPVFVGDVWSWDGTRWLELETVQSPGINRGAVFAYSAVHEGIVMAYGFASGLTLAQIKETWILKSLGEWERVFQTGVLPEARDFIGFATDVDRGSVVMQGGADQEAPITARYTDTWEFDRNGQWVELELGFLFDDTEVEVLSGARLIDLLAVSSSVLDRAGFFADAITAFDAVEVIGGAGNAIQYAFRIDGQLTWFDSVTSTWVASDGSVAETNPQADIRANLSTLDLTGGKRVQNFALLVTAGVDTPELEQVTVTFNAVAVAELPPIEPPAPRECLVFGHVRDEDGQPIFEARVRVFPPAAGFAHGNHQIHGEPVSTTTNAAGRWELSLAETATKSQTVEFRITHVKEAQVFTSSFLGKTIPDEETKEFKDLS